MSAFFCCVLYHSFPIRAEDGEESEATTGELTEFIEKAKMGEITNQDIPKFAKMFKVRQTCSVVSKWKHFFVHLICDRI